ncbi:hypothetical protein, partial [uncultured Roseobacter sp.]|uniref:hypothetical protein n=1 Tax=uncultured Roseobacter sp. TaxID=114847 RepID=UPI00260395EF
YFHASREFNQQFTRRSRILFSTKFALLYQSAIEITCFEQLRRLGVLPVPSVVALFMNLELVERRPSPTLQTV